MSDRNSKVSGQNDSKVSNRRNSKISEIVIGKVDSELGKRPHIPKSLSGWALWMIPLPRTQPSQSLSHKSHKSHKVTREEPAKEVKVPGSSRVPQTGGWDLHQPPWSFGFDSQTRGTRENHDRCVKVQGSSRVPVVCVYYCRTYYKAVRWGGGSCQNCAARYLNFRPTPASGRGERRKTLREA